MERFNKIGEEDVGITEYIDSSNKGFKCVLKHRYSDFIVNEVDIDGNVGEIGGVKYKLIGAVKNKSDIFLCPKENYEEAIKVAKDNNYSIKIISVGTLKEAIEELKKL